MEIQFIDQTCTSASIDDGLAAGSADQCDFEDSGTSIAIDEQGSLTTNDADKLLLAGAYTDELKLTVSATVSHAFPAQWPHADGCISPPGMGQSTLIKEKIMRKFFATTAVIDVRG